jgi:hypothetical protein
MRRFLLVLMLVWAAPLAGQVAVTESPLTPEEAARVVAFFNDDATTRLNGDSRIAAGSEVERNVAVLDGSLTLAGRILGDLVVIHGNLVLEPGAEVTGTVTVIGGEVRGVENLRAERVTVHSERLRYELRDGMLLLMREVHADQIATGREFGFGRTDIVVAARGGYNRSEGLPIHIGPRLTLGRRNPTRLEALFIYRTAADFEFDQDDYGYALTAEQFVGGKQAARIGLRYASEVLPVERWGLTDRETSLAAFILHRDYRDHYNRDGLSAYLAAGRGGLPLDWRIEFGNYEYGRAPLRDPFSILHNGDAWRREVEIPNVRLRTLGIQTRYDTRNDNRDPSTGWLVRADAEAALSLRSGDPALVSNEYRYGLLDIRRYARLTPASRIALRAVAAGAINENALPPWNQQALGAEGSLPGYELHEFDCGGHDAAPELAQSPWFGCDRLMLLQVEYQSNVQWLSRFGRDIGVDFGLLNNIKWLLFFDSGRTWTPAAQTTGRENGTDDFVVDAGFGLKFGNIGAYWAVPLSGRGGGMNFFVRIGPRI